MSKTLLVVFTVMMLGGCQIKQFLPTPDNGFTCIAGDIGEWMILEQQYQQSRPEGKAAMLKQAADKDQVIIQAMLLSQPDNTTAQIKRSIELFEQLDLDKTPQCDAEQYLLVRYQYTQAVMTLQRALNTADLERKALSAERDKLRQQIEALTRIENDLSR
ncbi:hypothetical protein SAMN03080615_00518 [Amphritea atlantica]|jgi:hypothetical protein|uniref:Lipoprotein n=1 Tax=Amphritea atlantica TaxID=355243 RepID=A0A1H9DF53_9GAMM|nr:hypothetical protein [Amphritea atlantica]SEQ12094.1 hypothetical protein SAMN03080615_00518 [Amphritea atlantica]